MIERWFAVEIDRHMGFEHLETTQDLFCKHDLTPYVRPNYENGVTTYFLKKSKHHGSMASLTLCNSS
jgi:hypothetical protein